MVTAFSHSFAVTVEIQIGRNCQIDDETTTLQLFGKCIVATRVYDTRTAELHSKLIVHSRAVYFLP